MVSPEFEKAVSERNLLLTRIMLKDSFVLDPTFAQFEEMLDYAKPYFPDLFDPFDGEILEDDSSKWDEALMNKELVQLISNFSEERVDHLKMVVAKVLKPKSTQLKNSEKYNQPSVSTDTSTSARDSIKNEAESIRSEANRILKLMNVFRRGNYKMSDINSVESAAAKILESSSKILKQ